MTVKATVTTSDHTSQNSIDASPSRLPNLKTTPHLSPTTPSPVEPRRGTKAVPTSSSARTRQATLYRLRSIAPNRAGLHKAIRSTKLAETEATIEHITVADAPAVLVYGQFHDPHPSWCADLAVTTGVQVNQESIKGGALLLFTVDGLSYALGYGNGHRLLADEAKDPRFGLSYAIRCVDPQKVKDIVRSALGANGRTDSTYASNTLPIWAINLNERAEIVKRLGGHTRDSAPESSGRSTSVEGGVGVQARFPIDPDKLVAQIRGIAKTCATVLPDPALTFIEHIAPVTDPHVLEFLDTELDVLLGIEDDLSILMAAAIPAVHMPEIRLAKSISINIAGAVRVAPTLDLADITTRTNQTRPGRRVAALRDGTIKLHSEPDGCGEVTVSTAAIRWLETELTKGSQRFGLHDGAWYEIDADYLDNVTDRVNHLVTRPPSLVLPDWESDKDEAAYNDWVGISCKDFLNLDKNLVRTRIYRNNGVEVCDLLGPNDELIHVKRAKDSGKLSHLFAQGVNAVEHLRSPEGRQGFHAVVAEHGREISTAFVPKKLIFAILLPPGKSLAQNLFPFSRVALVQTVAALEARGVEVEIMGVDPV